MKQSEDISELAKAFIAFKIEHPAVIMDAAFEMKGVTKRGTAYTIGSVYASLSGIKDNIEPVLLRHGLAFNHFPDGNNLVVTLMHKSGQYMQSSMDLNEMNTINEHGVRINSGPQDYGSLLSFAERYSAYAVLGLIGEKKKDSDTKPPQNATGNQGESQHQSTSKQNNVQLPWLNKVTIKGDGLPEWAEAVKDMTEGHGDIEILLQKYRINKDNRNDLLRIKENYISIDKLSHMTEEVKKKINDSKSLPQLQFVWDSYKGLQVNQDFIDSVNMKKKILILPKQTPQLTLD